MNENIVIGDVRPRIQAVGDGVQTDFIYPFPIFTEGDLKVYLDDIPQVTGFTVSGAGQSNGGTVVFDTAPAVAQTVTLRRLLTIERNSDFSEGGAFHADVINKELDYLVAVTQQNADALDRVLALDPTDADVSFIVPEKSERADCVLAFDADGSPIAGPAVYELTNAKTAAETALAGAEAAQTAALNAEAGAVSAQADAETALAGAVAARNEAESFAAASDLSSYALNTHNHDAVYRKVTDSVDGADLVIGSVTQDKIDPAVSLGGGGPSLGTDSIIRTNADTISENLTIPAGTNGMSAGPITIADGYTLTVNGNYTVV